MVKPWNALPVLGPEAKGGDAVQSHTHSHVPADHVRDRQRIFDDGSEEIPFGHVFPPSCLWATRPLGCVGFLDGGDLVVLVRASLDGNVLLLGTSLGPLRSYHEPVLGGKHWPVAILEDLTRPFVYGAFGELTRLVQHTDQCVPPDNVPIGSQGRPPLASAGRVERVYPS